MNENTRMSMASSAKNDWGTPEAVLQPVYDEMGGISLDPCANVLSLVKCNVSIAPPLDGLSVLWHLHAQGPGVIFVNPPYGRGVKHWTRKCIAEASTGAEIVLLVAARVDTRWFQELFYHADAICFWRGRIKFIDFSTGKQDTGAFFPSAIVYFGKNTDNFKRAFGSKGFILTQQELCKTGI